MFHQNLSDELLKVYQSPRLLKPDVSPMALQVSAFRVVALHKDSGQVLNSDLIVLSNFQLTQVVTEADLADILFSQPFAKFSLN
jgi:hypothetical protein